MKSLLLLATLILTSVASASATITKAPSSPPIIPAPGQNLYSAAPPAPEPSHAMLLMMGLFGFAIRRRR